MDYSSLDKDFPEPPELPHLVYDNILDKKYKLEVLGDPKDWYKGELVLTEIETNKELLREPVGISYGAQFGPDVSDVAEWDERAINFVDNELEK